MVFESVCLVDMIVLDMFRTHVGWRKSFEKFFGQGFKGTFPENCSKWQKLLSKAKKGLNFAIFAVLSNFLEKIPSKLRPKKFSNDFLYPT